MKTLLRISLVLLVSVLLLSACDKKGKPGDPRWSEYISEHSTGMLSRQSEIRLRFVNDVAEEAQIGHDASDIVTTSPKVSGSTLYSGRREIVIKADKGLEPGERYLVRVHAKNVKGAPSDLADYEFPVEVIKQSFEVSIAGLVTDSTDTKRQSLLGSLVTADVEDAQKVEKVLSAELGGKELPLKWQHGIDGRTHEFRVNDIRRGDNAAELVVIWDGDAIGVDNEGRTSIDVPASGDFTVLKAEAVRGDRQYIQIVFSDRLDAAQSMEGLIRLSEGEFSLRVEGNIVKLYPENAAHGNYTVSVEQGIRNESGARIQKSAQYEVFFEAQKPQVRFAGSGVILPENQFLTIPFEAINARSVQVTAFRVFENNVGQFLQSNKLDGGEEMGRVGRFLWRKTIDLGKVDGNKWNRFSLDATRLLKEHPGGLFRLTLSINRGNAVLSCTDAENAVPVEKESPPADNEDLYVTDSSGWDYAEEYFGEYSYPQWTQRNNPCSDAYYRYGSGVSDSRNFISSNIGLIAKQDGRELLRVVTTNLKTAAPMSGVKVEVRNFQDQTIGSADSDSQGFAEVKIKGVPFYVIAQKEARKGYLKTNTATALPVSHFDVGGESVKAGIKGYIYGERGVWRPGDDIHLTFVLEDKDGLIPEGHPVSMQLYNPQGQLMQSLVNGSPVGDFYVFTLKTDDNAPTGNWTAKAILGGSVFEKKLKIETVMPNRLKVELDFGKDVLYRSETSQQQATLFAQWLHGADAANLRANVDVDFTAVPTAFTRAADYVFDDPTRQFSSEPESVFDGALDARGYATFSGGIWPRGDAPGMLQANFTSRVFEEGGAFSVSHTSLPYHPYDNYVGIKLPKGDAIRGMLLTDIKHPVEIATLNAKGEPVSLKQVQVTLYKIDWRWWWDKSGETLAQYASAENHSQIQQAVISTVNGRGVWDLEVKYPDWGRYLIRACDLDGEHCSGKVFYIDWPGWAERAQEEGGVGANVLTLLPDKNQYNVGETARVRLPEASQGRALVSIENGVHVLQQRWIEFGKDKIEFDFKVTREMSPNVYINVSLIQPHQDRDNDRPIRLYGVVPVKVDDPATRLAPQLKAAEEWAPNSRVEVQVSEAQGRAMTYTLAVVDEGLLGLTNFKTPDLHAQFYKKEALGVPTWDLFDQVTGAYGGELERLLALGGGEEGELAEGQEEKRFPPVVRFIGPFELAAGKTGKHAIDLPQYIGAVRVMVVAGRSGAYGAAEKSVFVRDALSLLPTVPRVLGPDEELTVPVSVFVMKDGVKQVKLSVATSPHFTVVDKAPQTLDFNGQGEQLGFIRLKVQPELGKGRLKFSADGGGYHSESEIFIDIRASNPQTLQQTTQVLKAGGDWSADIVPHGLPGTNKVMLEVSAVPPLNIERRLGYLIAYPHGCVEQVTSAVFPQLYLASLVKLDQRQKQEIQNNIQAGIERLRGFQSGNGGFLYWPGGWSAGVNDWATNYAGHFLVEASRLGYQVPSDMLTSWINYQTQAAQSRITATGQTQLDQAYRLYTLALANKPDIGSMNRLRELGGLDSVTRWQLAAAYKLAGQTDAAQDLVDRDSFRFRNYATPDDTFGSVLRDQAIVLNGLVLLGDDRAKRLAEDVSDGLYADRWYSTQSVAYALLAMAKFTGADGLDDKVRFTYSAGGPAKQVEMEAPIYTAELADFPAAGAPVKLENESRRKLYATILSTGVPRAGSETAAADGLRLEISYTDKEGHALDVSALTQGVDFIATARVRNLTERQIDNIALTHIVPSGWEIHNPRMSGADEGAAAIDYQDIRDDRVLTYFNLKPQQEKSFQVLLNAAYLGRYYLPSVTVEAMYDATRHAHTMGQWIQVEKGAR
ncbi:MAG TPA: MG2 domain-containing protein [Gammaproteobacteria bacterium]|nr:MG2 domain-containing protein [Gammaproteobacteria bacterium]